MAINIMRPFAMQYEKTPDPGGELGRALGGGLGEGIGAGLQQMANEKISDRLRALEAKRTEGALASILPNLAPERRAQLSQLSPEQQKFIIPSLIKARQQEGINSLYGDFFGTTPTGVPGGQATGGAPSSVVREPGAAQQVGAPAQEPIVAEEKLPPGIISNAEIARKERAIKRSNMAGHNETAMKMQTQLDTEKKTRLEWEGKKAEAATKKEISDYKLTEPIRKMRKTGLEELQRNMNARELLQKGDFTNPVWAGLVNLLPPGVGQAFLTNDTVALKAMGVNGFLKSLKDVFGPQISDSDIKEMYSAIISPMNSKEKNLALMDFFDKVTESKMGYADTWDEVNAKYPDMSTVKKLEKLDTEWSRKIRQGIKQQKGEIALASKLKEDAKIALNLPTGYSLGEEEFDEMPDPRTYKDDLITNPDGVAMKKNADKTEWIKA